MRIITKGELSFLRNDLMIKLALQRLAIINEINVRIIDFQAELVKATPQNR